MGLETYAFPKALKFMIKLSKMADYAVVILAEMSRRDGKLCTAGQLAGKTSLPEPTVAKVLKLLARGEIIISTRGAAGGYKLGQSPDQISVATIVTALDGPIALTACVDGSEECCSHSPRCPIKDQWAPVNNAMKAALESVSLAQMIGTIEVTL
jgi:FeS assembly SUF system regulator